MMRFVDDHEIKVRRGVEIQKPVLLTSAVIFALIYAAVQNGIRNDGLVIAYWPFFVSVGVGYGLPEDRAVERDEILIEAFHFKLPFPLCYQRLRADDQNIVQLASGFQFLHDQTGFDRFADADTVRDQDLRLIRFDKLQSGAELIRHEIDSCRVQRI